MGLYDSLKEKIREKSRKGQEELQKEMLGEKEASNFSKIGKKEVLEATKTLREYKAMKTHLEEKIIANEEWWKMRWWEHYGDAKQKKTEDSASGWLFNCIISKHADAMDAFPEPNMLPREQDDKEEAESLSEIVPMILSQNRMRKVYSKIMWYKLIQGTGVFGVFWDKTKLNGLGDISVRKADLLNLFWDMSVEDIQDSENFFSVKIVPRKKLEQAYPNLKGKLTGSSSFVKEYVHDDHMNTKDKSMVVDWYYKKQVGGRNILHFCQFVGTEVIYATENEPEFAEKGLYDHGKYPYVFDPLFPVNDLAIGFGYVDVCKKAQKEIDELGEAIMTNAKMGSTPRYFIHQNGSVNEEEFVDWRKPLVHVNGSLAQESLRPVDTKQLDGVYVTILNNKIEELKETSGNRDVANGGTVSGVTAASGIAALQEQSGKTSRDSTEASYTAYEDVVELIIELIRQFYDVPRKFRITGKSGEEKYISYSNEGIKPRMVPGQFGLQDVYRLPVFDIEINAQKESPYSKLSQNELAMEMYQKGFFNPEMVDQALACLEVMDFNHKEDVTTLIQKNGTMYQKLAEMEVQMAQMAEIIDALQGSSLSGQLAPLPGQQTPPAAGGSSGRNAGAGEHAFVERARQQAQEAAQPR